MKKSSYKINTTEFRKLAKKHGYPIKKLAREAAELTGISCNTLNGHMLGTAPMSCISGDEIAAYSAILNEPEDAIRRSFNSKKNTSEKKAPIHNDDEEYFKFNVDALKAAIGNKSMYSVEKDAGISPGMCYRLLKGGGTDRVKVLKICKVLGKAPEELVIGWIEDGKPVAKKPSIKPVDGVLNVFDVFKIMNSNLGELMDAVNNKAQADSIKGIETKLDALTDKVKFIEEALIGLNKMVADGKAKFPREEREAPTLVQKTFTVGKDTEYNPKDDLETYSAKTDALVKKIAAHRGHTMNQVRHDFYETMKNTYGVVWEQLQRDYYKKHGKKQTWSLALLYDHGLFGQIYYNILATECSKIDKKVS